jgi:hypothetical protein
MTYLIHTSKLFGTQTVYCVETGSWTTTENPDYLAWVAEGNTAEEWQPDGN